MSAANFLLLAGLWYGIEPAQLSADNARALDTAIAILRNQEENLGATTLTMVADNVGRFVGSRNTRDRHIHKLTFLGRKHRLEQDMQFDVEANDAHGIEVDAFNAETRYQHRPEQKSGSRSSQSDFSLASYHSFLYLELWPLHRTLEANKRNLMVEHAGDLLRLHWEKVPGATIHLELDPSKGYQPRKVARRTRGLKPLPTVERVGENLEVSVKDYRQLGEFYFPSNFEQTFDLVRADGTVERFNTLTVVVKDVETNVPVTAKTFEIDFPEGTTVLDRDAEVVYVVGDPRSRRRAPTPAGDVRVPPETVTRWGWATPAFVAVGIALLLGAGVVVWRRR